MNNVITVNNVDLAVLQYRGHRVITMAQVDAAHGRPPGTAGRNFREHRDRFVEGTDYFDVTADEIRRQSLEDAFPPRTPRAILLTETGYTMLVKPFNDDLAWQVQRQIVSGYFAAARLLTGQPAAPQLAGYVADGCMLIESMNRTLNLAQSATLGMYQKLGAKAGISDLVPAYAIDAPSANSGGSSPTLALKDLLIRFQVGISPQKAYRILEQAGLVERLSRPGKTATKWFWAITEAGKAYGKNMTSPANPRETQPHFYISEFPKLLEAIGLRGLLGAA